MPAPPCQRGADWGETLLQIRDMTVQIGLQRHHEAIERATGVGSWEIDLETDEICRSPTILEAHLGLNPARTARERVQAAIGRYPKEVQERFAAALAELQAIGAPHDVVVPFDGEDGQRRWRRLTGNAEKRGGRVVRVFGTLEDVTDARAKQQHLRLLDAVASGTTNSSASSG